MNYVNLNPETQTDVSKLEVLISRQQLQERIRELGQTISADYKNKELDLVGVLKGGFIFLETLSGNWKFPAASIFFRHPATRTARPVQEWSGSVMISNCLESM